VLRSSALIRPATQYIKRHWVIVRSGLRAFIASATGSILSLFSSNIQVVGTNILSPDFSMGIITACTGLVAMAIFTSAVLAYPSSIVKKAEGIAMGIAGLFIFNLVRMAGLFVVGSYLPDFFNSAHYIVGQSLMILLAIGLWLFWLEKRVHVTSR